MSSTDKTRKVAIICGYFYEGPEHMGGAEYQMHLWTKYLLEREKSLQIYYLFPSSKVKTISVKRISKRLILYEFPKMKMLGKLGNTHWYYTFYVYKLMKFLDPDIVLIRSLLNLGLGAVIFARKYRKKAIWWCSQDNETSKNYLKPISVKKPLNLVSVFFEKLVKEKVHERVFQTEDQKFEFERNFNLSGNVIPNIIDPSEIISPHRKETLLLQKITGPKKVIWVENLKEIKRPELFIKLAKNILKEDKTVEFMMIGRIASKKYTTINLEISHLENVFFLGFKSQEEVYQLLEQAYLLVNTSISEGFPNVFLQAFAKGVPVVSLKVNPDDIFNKFEVGYCANGDFIKFVKLVRLILQNPELYIKLANNALQYAAIHHHPENYLLEIKKILDIEQINSG